jgi:hypothetical protein
MDGPATVQTLLDDHRQAGARLSTRLLLDLQRGLAASENLSLPTCLTVSRQKIWSKSTPSAATKALSASRGSTEKGSLWVGRQESQM